MTFDDVPRASRGPCIALALLLAASCGSDDDAPSSDDAGPPSAATGLPVLHAFDPDRAARGALLLTTPDGLQSFAIPRMALRYLWLVWGTRQGTDEEHWAAFRARYGFHESPFPNEGLPLGLRPLSASVATIDCLACHGDTVAGTVVIGAGNSVLDLQGLYDDLVALRRIASMAGIPVPEIPWTLEGITGAAGATDAFGMGMTLAHAAAPGVEVNTEYGFQQPPAWWTMPFKDRRYTDGSGRADGYRLMMATLLASGASLSALEAMDADFADLDHYLLSLSAPRWTLTAIDPARAERGRVVFEAECSTCHGVYSGTAAAFPDRVVDRAELGTDPLRAERFGTAEAGFVNASWFGRDAPMEPTGGYLAPPLTGVWASAPYLHDGSVPTLRALLDSRTRPTRWRRTGTGQADYDPDAVGWRYEVVDEEQPDTIVGRRTYDTTRAGLGNGGHDYGDALTEEERADVIEYVRSL